MKTFQLTRKEMSDLLLSLKGWNEKKPLSILQEAWVKSHKEDVESGKSITAFITTALAPIFEKIIKSSDCEMAFSLNEIVSLGNQIFNTNFSITALQNWVKRDIKEMIGSPQKGKKYSIEQTALLFLVEDLKTALDFESIRQLLKLVVNDPDNQNDDLINPVHLYAAYSSLFEHLNEQEQTNNNDKIMRPAIESIERTIVQKARAIISTHPNLNDQQKEAIQNLIVIATLSVYTAYFQVLSKRYLSATLFLHDLSIIPNK